MKKSDFFLSVFISRRGVRERRRVGRRATPSGPTDEAAAPARRLGVGGARRGRAAGVRREDVGPAVVLSALAAAAQEVEVQRGVVPRVLARCRRLEVGLGRPRRPSTRPAPAASLRPGCRDPVSGRQPRRPWSRRGAPASANPGRRPGHTNATHRRLSPRGAPKSPTCLPRGKGGRPFCLSSSVVRVVSLNSGGSALDARLLAAA